jgi:hypothetical protein
MRTKMNDAHTSESEGGMDENQDDAKQDNTVFSLTNLYSENHACPIALHS